MTIRRQLFWSAAYFFKRTLTYLPHSGPGLPTWGNPQADQWPGVKGKEHQILLCDWIQYLNLLLLVEVHVGKERWWGVGGSYSLVNCPATEELAPNCHQIISVLLYIPYSFMMRSRSPAPGDLLRMTYFLPWGYFLLYLECGGCRARLEQMPSHPVQEMSPCPYQLIMSQHVHVAPKFKMVRVCRCWYSTVHMSFKYENHNAKYLFIWVSFDQLSKGIVLCFLHVFTCYI